MKQPKVQPNIKIEVAARLNQKSLSLVYNAPDLCRRCGFHISNIKQITIGIFCGYVLYF